VGRRCRQEKKTMNLMTARGRRAIGIPARRPHAARTVLPALAVAAVVAGALLSASPATAQKRGPQSVAPVAEELIEAVVNISTSQAIKGPQGLPLPSVPKG